MDHIESVEARNPQFAHRDALHLPHEAGRRDRRAGFATGDIEDRSDPVCADDGIELVGIDPFLRFVQDGRNVQLDHLADLILEGHPGQDPFDLPLYVGIAGNGGPDAPPTRNSDRQKGGRCQKNRCTTHNV